MHAQCHFVIVYYIVFRREPRKCDSLLFNPFCLYANKICLN